MFHNLFVFKNVFSDNLINIACKGNLQMKKNGNSLVSDQRGVPPLPVWLENKLKEFWLNFELDSINLFVPLSLGNKIELKNNNLVS